MALYIATWFPGPSMDCCLVYTGKEHRLPLTKRFCTQMWRPISCFPAIESHLLFSKHTVHYIVCKVVLHFNWQLCSCKSHPFFYSMNSPSDPSLPLSCAYHWEVSSGSPFECLMSRSIANVAVAKTTLRTPSQSVKEIITFLQNWMSIMLITKLILWCFALPIDIQWCQMSS